VRDTVSEKKKKGWHVLVLENVESRREAARLAGAKENAGLVTSCHKNRDQVAIVSHHILKKKGGAYQTF